MENKPAEKKVGTIYMKLYTFVLCPVFSLIPFYALSFFGALQDRIESGNAMLVVQAVVALFLFIYGICKIVGTFFRCTFAFHMIKIDLVISMVWLIGSIVYLYLTNDFLIFIWNFLFPAISTAISILNVFYFEKRRHLFTPVSREPEEIEDSDY